MPLPPISFVTPDERKVLAGQEATSPSAVDRDRRVAAAYARGHELVAEQKGEGCACEPFTGEPGLALLNALRAQPTTATVNELVAIAAAHVTAFYAPPQPQPQPQPDPE